MNAVPLPSPRYIPVLKVKPGEKEGLEILPPGTLGEVWPLFEIVEMGDDLDLPNHLRKAFAGLPRALRHCPAFLLDTHEIASTGAEGARASFEAARSLGVPFIPVTGISRHADVAEAVAFRTRHGLAIRLRRSEFESGIVPRRLLSFLKTHKLTPADIHLLVDIGAVDEILPEGIASMISTCLPLVPQASEWRTLAVVACAFPKSMGVAAPQAETIVERADWKGWLRACFNVRSTLPRLPVYGDGGIQHPSGVEDFDFTKMSVSATVRYALEDGWVLVKGVSTDTTPASEQFPELARRLVASTHFAGPNHCPACAAIARTTRGPTKGLKRAVDWRRLGTAHHIATTVQQLRALLPAT